ncbi:MAG: RecQ family ATP-dependent DNA helicase [Gemmatimonadales bacterium]|jgi:ATP-dependent DNA helicase RecQ
MEGDRPADGDTGGVGVPAALRVLRERFGHADFRPGQAAVVAAMAAGRDVLAVLPTGAGKSLCYQVPALLVERPTIVVSPLIALIEDQVAALRRRGIPSSALTSAVQPGGRRAAEARFGGSGPLLLYVAPERLATPAFVELARRARPARIVVDEAHCISEWGHDFRPDYRRIGAFADAVGAPAMAAFTATATPETRRDIVHQLALRSPVRVVRSVDRPNLFWQVEPARDAGAALARVGREVRARGDGAAIVYVGTRALATGSAAALRRLGQSAAAYHAGLSPRRRAAVQAAFTADPRGVVCATCAFGMGIDHPGVRLVAHVGMPGALESYVQEAGRAGRDGGPSRCLLVPLASDTRRHGRRIRELPRRSRRRARRRLAAMVAYVRERRCRRRAIAAYFGEPAPLCGGCDLCGPPPGGAGDRLGSTPRGNPRRPPRVHEPGPGA